MNEAGSADAASGSFNTQILQTKSAGCGQHRKNQELWNRLREVLIITFTE
jgi:hypothetical protein